MNVFSSLAEHYLGTVSWVFLICIFLIAALIWYALKNNESVKTTFLCRYFGFSLETSNTSANSRKR